MPTISDTVRNVIRDRGLSYSEVGRLAGVQPSQIGRFMKGERGLTSDSLDRICIALGLELLAIDDFVEFIAAGDRFEEGLRQLERHLDKVASSIQAVKAKAKKAKK
jgi:transcriptional regulator with XRE-family HTH domain